MLLILYRPKLKPFSLLQRSQIQYLFTNNTTCIYTSNLCGSISKSEFENRQILCRFLMVCGGKDLKTVLYFDISAMSITNIIKFTHLLFYSAKAPWWVSNHIPLDPDCQSTAHNTTEKASFKSIGIIWLLNIFNLILKYNQVTQMFYLHRII